MHIGIINIMPDKRTSQEQFYTLFKSYGTREVECTCIQLHSHRYSETSKQEVADYASSHTIFEKKYTHLVITGAALETTPYSHIDFQKELDDILEFVKDEKIPTLCVCFAAMYATSYFLNVPKKICRKKLFGIYEETFTHSLYEGISKAPSLFYLPQSRYFTFEDMDETKYPIHVISYHKAYGISAYRHQDFPLLCVSGHPEYTKDTLYNEYVRDTARGIPTRMPHCILEDGSECVYDSKAEQLLWEPYMKHIVHVFQDISRRYAREEKKMK